jgi:hypothetical protein
MAHDRKKPPSRLSRPAPPARAAHPLSPRPRSLHSLVSDELPRPSATGSFKLHQIQEQELVTQALGGAPAKGRHRHPPGTVATATQQTATSG